MKRSGHDSTLRARASAALLCAATIGLAWPPALAQRRGTTQAGQAGGATLFEVSAQPDGVQIEPVVRVVGGRLVEVVDTGKGPLNKQLAAGPYKPGRQLSVIFGGGRAGTLTVKPKLPDSECSLSAANATLNAPAVNLGLNVFALATDSPTLGRPAPARRAPTDGERAAVNKVVAEVYRDKEVPEDRAAAFETINLTATDLNGDGAAELVGTFKLKRTPEITDMLFLMTEGQGADLHAAFVNYEKVEKAALDEINDEAFAAVGPAGFLFEVLLDQLDIDGDGWGEVFTRAGSFEGVNFYVYKRNSKLLRWQRVGEFSNYHCAY
jgi:hypothetical protein